MRWTRRNFHRLALGCSAYGAVLSARPGLFAQEAPEVPFQPFAAQLARLLTSLHSLGTPLRAEDTGLIEATLQHGGGGNPAAVIHTLTTLLDRYVILEVTLNPEMRVSVRGGRARPELIQGGWRTFLIKVFNQAGTTPVLRIKSPQAASVGRRSSLAITGVHDFTNGAVDEVEARARWIALSQPDGPPLLKALSGLSLEYRILQLYSRDAGEREATLQADVGYGEQDLGYRSSLAILFHCMAAQQVRVHVLDETGAPSIASLHITDTQGRTYPPQNKRELPDLNFEPQVYRYNGESLLLPAGTFQVEFGRGPEYLRQRTSLTVHAGAPAILPLQLKRWVTPASAGYYSGDTHIHAAGCSHYESPTEGVDPIVMERQVDGEALDLGSVLNWGPGFAYQKQFFSGHAEPMRHAEQHVPPTSQHRYSRTPHNHAQIPNTVPDASAAAPINPQHPGASIPSSMDTGTTRAGMPHDAAAIAEEQQREVIRTLQAEAQAPAVQSLVRYDVEVSGFPSSHCGHLVLLRLHSPDFPDTKNLDDWPSWNMPILRWAKLQGAFVGYAHSAHGLVVDSTKLPNLLMPAFNSMGANEFIADVTHEGTIDFISGCDLWPFAEMNIWYHTMNCGYSTPFAGETDFPCITDACVGGGRSYVPLHGRAAGDAGYTAWIESLLHGSSYFGDGRSHLFRFSVNAQPRTRNPVVLGGMSDVEVSAEVCAWLEPEPTEATRAIQEASPYDKPYWHIERARIGSSRRVPVELIANGIPIAQTEVDADGNVHSVRLRTQLRESSWLALRIYPSSHSNPVVVTVAGKPVRASRQSAAWCRRAVDVCWEQKRQRIRQEELAAASACYQHARLAYDRIFAESSGN